MKRFIAGLALLPLLSCSSLGAKAGSEILLFNPVVTSQGLEVSVLSNGCTQAEQFYLKLRQDQIELRRTEPDLCRAAPHLVRLEFSYSFAPGVYRFKNDTRFSDRVVR
ncbi:hypothetical protein [Reinekea sp.]|jgi:hypothetical protein|uniref:hypothetical protein n=1 Tax=Reinekea sp. TaxID=1970455 RepID=UPI002A837C58|nr:hypothetical protein [Reinekea sp.]